VWCGGSYPPPPLHGYIIYMQDGYIHLLRIKGNDFHHLRRFIMG